MDTVSNTAAPNAIAPRDQTASAQTEAGFEYGWCRTDHKTGRELRPEFRKTDYMLHEPYASSVASMLTRMGLPQPHIDQVYRGTHHDMLFIESHGVVVRIGPTDVEDLIHPAILQPLGWLDDKDNGISVAVYPGIELYNTDMEIGRGDNTLSTQLLLALSRTGQGSSDLGANNLGIIRINKNGIETPVAVLLDPDNQFNGTNNDETKRRKRSIMAQGDGSITNKSSGSGSVLRSKSIEQAMNSVFDVESAVENWKLAFETHQPLRTAFWMAWRNADPNKDAGDPAYLSRFWAQCAAATKQLQRVMVHEWEETQTASGAPAEAYSQKLYEFALYKPWTADPQDNKTKRLGAAASFDHYLDQAKADPKTLAKAPRWMRRNKNFMGRALDVVAESYRAADPILHDNPDYMAKAIQKNAADGGAVFDVLSNRLKQDSTFLVRALLGFEHQHHAARGEFFSKISSAIPEYEKIALHMLTRDADYFNGLTRALKNDGTFIAKAVELNPLVYEIISEKFRADPDIAMQAIKKNWSVFKKAPASIRASKAHLMAVSRDSQGVLEYASEALRDDDEVIETFIARNPYNLAGASDRLIERHAADVISTHAGVFGHLPDKYRARLDLAILSAEHRFEARNLLKRVLPPLDIDPLILQLAFEAGAPLAHASERAKDNPDIVLMAMKSDRYAFEYAGPTAKDTPAVAMEALRERVKNYYEISPRLKNDPDFIIGALQAAPALLTLDCLEGSIRNNPKVILNIAENKPEALTVIGDELLKDHDFMVELVKRPHIQAHHLRLPDARLERADFVRRLVDIRPDFADYKPFTTILKDAALAMGLTDDSGKDGGLFVDVKQWAKRLKDGLSRQRFGQYPPIIHERVADLKQVREPAAIKPEKALHQQFMDAALGLLNKDKPALPKPQPAKEIGHITVTTQPPFALEHIRSAFIGAKIHASKGRDYLLDLHGVTILLLHKNTDNAVTGIYSPCSKAELQEKCKTLQNTHPAAYAYIAQTMLGLAPAARNAPSNTARKTT